MTTFYLTELQTAVDRCLDTGFTCFVSFYASKVHVTLNKYAHSGTPGLAMEVKAEGVTVIEAFERALANFPANPLDGATKWHDPRIAGPITEGEFTELGS